MIWFPIGRPDVKTDFETDEETLILFVRNQPIERETMRRGIREVMDLYHPAIKESGQDMLTMIELKNAK